MSMAALLAFTSVATWASSVTIPNSFTAGETAVAADVNANFDAVAASVNDNDSRVTTNAGNISTNAGDISTNAGDISTNSAAITANGITSTSDHENRIAANETAISDGTSCPAGEMVAVGSLCVDTYEASVWDTASGPSQILDGALPCATNGSDCGANAANPIYARSVPNVTPAAQITWYQAVQACANVGKRLPTTAEWQMAASGTPSPATGGTDPTQECNTSTAAAADTGASSAGATPCVSSAGAFDMVGNLWEWTAELTDLASGGGFTFLDTDSAVARVFGSSYNSGIISNTQSVATVGAGPSLANNVEIGFRCVQ